MNGIMVLGSYHSYDCPELSLNKPEGNFGQYYIADQSAEFKYDAKRIQTKIWSKNNQDYVVALYNAEKNQYFKPKYDNINDEITLGDEIDRKDIFNYNFKYKTDDGQEHTEVIADLSLLANAKADLYSDKYVYDHKNLACYTCCVSRDYNPVVKYYKGNLRRVYITKDKELLVEMTPGARDFVYYANGETFGGTVKESDMPIDEVELENRQLAVYTYLAHIRNNLYKHNDYINR